MKKIVLASVAAFSLAAAIPAFSQDADAKRDADTGAVVGATGGGVAGAAIGGLLAGPVGAVIGGFAGATLGAEAGVAAGSIEYASTHPVETVVLSSTPALGAVVPDDVTIYPIEGDAKYGYIYANDRVWIVDMADRTLVQSPGYIVPTTAADYAIAHPVASVKIDDAVVGYVLPDGTEISNIPDSGYGYVYVNDRPALVDKASRTIVWIG